MESNNNACYIGIYTTSRVVPTITSPGLAKVDLLGRQCRYLQVTSS